MEASSSSCFISDLPSPIRMEILCRLPIKTLTPSKSVCRSWLHLIGDPHFSQLHQARAQTEIYFRHCRNDCSTKLHLGNFRLVNDTDVNLNTLLDFPRFVVRNNNALNHNAVGEDFLFANSCNALLCYYGRVIRYAVVWNPCTNEFITFPAPETHEEGSRVCTLGYGFGFSRKANKFKLLRTICRNNTNVGEICTIEESCSWKTVGPPVSVSCLENLTYVTLLQDTLHWVSLESSVFTIQTFGFEDDQFGRLALPPYFNRLEETLGVLSGCLALTDLTYEGVDIWLMMEYGVRDSWTKLFCLGSTLGNGLKYKHCLPITDMDNGEVLMMYTDFTGISTVFFYNPILESARVMGSGPASLRVTAYKPSLVLLKDSMLGYEVHVNPMEKSPRQHGAKVIEELRKEREQRQELEETLRNVLANVEQLKQQNQQLEKRLGRIS